MAMLDLKPFNMYRVVTCTLMNESLSISDVERLVPIWKEGEIIQLASFPGGNLYFACPITKGGKMIEERQAHIFDSYFRDLTEKEREEAGLPPIEIPQAEEKEWRSVRTR